MLETPKSQWIRPLNQNTRAFHSDAPCNGACGGEIAQAEANEGQQEQVTINNKMRRKVKIIMVFHLILFLAIHPSKGGVTKRAKYQTFDIVPIGLQTQ